MQADWQGISQSTTSSDVLLLLYTCLLLKNTRGHIRRPNGVALMPWSKGKFHLWDATCSDTLAKSYI
jgi:hypothetical protein